MWVREYVSERSDPHTHRPTYSHTLVAAEGRLGNLGGERMEPGMNADEHGWELRGGAYASASA